MKIKVPVLIQDQMVAARKGFEPTETVFIDERFFLDGPISERVAIIDFDSDGAVRPGAVFTPPSGNSEGGYADAQVGFPSDPALQVSVFGTVHRTLALFEEPDALGRQVTWAFDGPQLLVVPRAGDWENAFYERDSRSLQFFHFLSARENYVGRTVFTCLSHDIVSHETAHAILDGIAPDLYNAISPQSLALHEAIADITALLMSIRSGHLRETVLNQTDGSLDVETAFSAIAEEFGVERLRIGPLRPLRSLLNDKTLPEEGGVRSSPHHLSEILSGALYNLLVEIYEAELKKRMAAKGQTRKQASGFALWVAGQKFKRMVLRALDYLPPGEISFADYGRAIVAADEVSHPHSPQERQWLVDEFKRRKIIKTKAALLEAGPDATRRNDLEKILAQTDLDTLVNSDWAAYEFTGRCRSLLGAPKSVPLRVRARQDVTKTYWFGVGDEREVRECIFKISWDAEEQNPRARGLPGKRQITMGTTLAIDWETKTIRALLTSDTSQTQRNDRDDSLLRLHRNNRLAIGAEAIGPDGKELRTVAVGEVSGDLIRIRKSARMLHIDALLD